MAFPVFIVGLIMRLIHHQYFTSQHNVGAILMYVGGGLVILQLLWMLIVGGIMMKQFNKTR